MKPLSKGLIVLWALTVLLLSAREVSGQDSTKVEAFQLPDSSVVTVTVGTQTVGLLNFFQRDSVHVTEYRSTGVTPPPVDSIPYARLLSVDDTIALIESAWADHAEAVSYGNFAYIEGVPGVLAHDKNVTGPHTLTVPLQSTSITAQVAVNGRRSDGSVIPAAEILPPVAIVLPPRQGNIVVPPDTTPPDTTGPTPPPSGATWQGELDQANCPKNGAGPNEPNGMTPVCFIEMVLTATAPYKIEGGSKGLFSHPTGMVVKAGSRGALLEHGPDYLRWNFPAGCNRGSSCGNKFLARFGLTPEVETYSRIEFRLAPNYWLDASGNKFYGPTQEKPATGNLFHVKHQPQNAVDGDPGAPFVGVSFGPKLNGWDRNLYQRSVTLTRGQWHVLEVYTKAASAPLVSDGIITVWQDGTRIIHATDVLTFDPNGVPGPGTLKFSGWDYVPIFGGNGGNHPATWMDIRSLYMSRR